MPIASWKEIDLGHISSHLRRNVIDTFPSHPDSMILNLKHIQPIQHHHRFDQVSFEIDVPIISVSLSTLILQSKSGHPLDRPRENHHKKRAAKRTKGRANIHPIKHIPLNTHIPRPQMFHPPPPRLDRNSLLKQHQRLVSLANHPLIRFFSPRRVRRDEQPRPERTLFPQIRQLSRGRVEDGVEPVEGRLQVEVVPEAVAEYEGVRFGGFAGAEEGFEPGEFFVGDGKADHLFDLLWVSMVGVVERIGMGKGGGLLITSIVLGLQDRLSGSLLTTSAVLKIPWMEQALTLNW